MSLQQNNLNRNKMKHDFLTTKFYENSHYTLMVFQELNKTSHIVDKDNYTSGTFLTLTVKDNEETRRILSPLILDFDKYRKYCQDHRDDVVEGEILLDGLQEIHTDYFDCENEIGYDRASDDYEYRYS